MNSSIIQGALFGLAIGDALGVPVEFTPRSTLSINPVIDMRGYGTHQQPLGTWSDDTSMTFCLAESMASGFSIEDLANRFVNWYERGYWTPYGTVFDIGITTRKAVSNIQQGMSLEKSGLDDELSNGNGSLMRILPLVFWLIDKPIIERIFYIRQVSSLTHRHMRSITACILYIEYARLLLTGYDKYQAYRELQLESVEIFNLLALPENEIVVFNQIIKYDIGQLSSSSIRGSGYVIHSLEASIWAFLTTNSYEEAVLRAINLGEDTDTTGTITGGIAGLFYRIEAIPKYWIEVLPKKELIFDLAERFQTVL